MRTATGSPPWAGVTTLCGCKRAGRDVKDALYRARSLPWLAADPDELPEPDDDDQDDCEPPHCPSCGRLDSGTDNDKVDHEKHCPLLDHGKRGPPEPLEY